MTVALDALVLPAFDDLAGLPGEARPWREAYSLEETIEVAGVPNPVRHGAGVGLVPTSIGKTAAATTTTALLASDRLALDDALVCSVGVAGGPPAVPVGSVVVADTVVDWDDKCRVDPGEGLPLAVNPYTEEQGVFHLDEALVERARKTGAAVSLTRPGGTDGTDTEGASAADPAVVGGTNVCGDELWHGRQVATQVGWLLDQHDVGPYRATEMEDAGTAAALARFDALDRYLSVRSVSNHDRPTDDTPARESLFSPAFETGFGTAIENAAAVAQAVVADHLGYDPGSSQQSV